ncbi:MAG: aminotransferase class IV [Maledivibacter sp.]|nr:aminotransferase class IV [Maledivibacter sp.]
MVKEAILDYLIYNSRVYSTKEIDIWPNTERVSIYEVIRIIDGIPLYLEEHLERLAKSAKLLNVKLNRTYEELTDEIKKLIEINDENNLNVKILCVAEGGEVEELYIYFIKSFYPPELMYREGIHTIAYESERQNPNAKTFNGSFKKGIAIELERRNAFEALLVNNDGQITEGSRSNLFFVKDEKLFTSPAHEVLLGVTRSKIIELCSQSSIDIIEQEISLDSISKYEGAFITGTSINVLPIKNIDGIGFDLSKNDIINKIIEIYEKDKQNYINKRRNI